ARRARSRIERELASGQRELDQATVAEYHALRCWVSMNDEPASSQLLISRALQHARNVAGQALHAKAGQIFDALRADAEATIQRLRDLPEPPAGLWHAPNPAQLLA